MANGGKPQEVDGNTANVVKEPEIQIDPSWNDPVSQESLIDAWKKYTRKMEKENPRFHSILLSHTPHLDGTILRLELTNKYQEQELGKEKLALFRFLKSELRNAQLTLEVTLARKESALPEKVFTAADKLKEMLEKNPILAKLKQKFNLDLD